MSSNNIVCVLCGCIKPSDHITGKIGEVCRHEADCFSSNSQCLGGRCSCLPEYQVDTNATYHCLGMILNSAAFFSSFRYK